MAEPLNPELYRRLKRLYRNVRISNDGQAMKARVVRDFLDDGYKLSISHTGEYYQVCCPFCRDTRFRLYINHMYGQRDSRGRKMNFLAICYNDEACMSKPACRASLDEHITESDGMLERVRIRKGEDVPEADRECHLPGPCTRVDALPASHHARTYLEGRGYDVGVLGRRYQVAWCSGSHFFLASNRIIIPVYSRGRLKGWQARYIGDLNWADKEAHHPPKYFNLPGMRRNQLLYNSDRASQYETVVVVEGPTDVWSLGPMGVCTFGCSLSDRQRRILAVASRGKSVVLLYDREAFEEAGAKKAERTLAKMMPGRFASVRLPHGRDPGSLERDFLRDYVAAKAAKQGVTVSWRKSKKGG